MKEPLKIATRTPMVSLCSGVVGENQIKIYQGMAEKRTRIMMGIGVTEGALCGARLVAKVQGSVLRNLFAIIFT